LVRLFLYLVLFFRRDVIILRTWEVILTDTFNIDGDNKDKQFIGSTVNYFINSTPSQIDDNNVLQNALEKLSNLPVTELAEHAPLPHPSHIPLLRNDTFTGRETSLIALAKALKGDDAAAIGQVSTCTGMGGIGKSQLASEFAHRYGQYFQGGVFWLNCAEPDAIGAAIAAFAQHYTDGQPPDDINEQIALVSSHWQDGLPRLLIFDNLEDPDLLSALQPPSGRCHILITSRNPKWPTEWIKDKNQIPLDVLSPDESVELLLQYQPDLKEQQTVLAELADLLGRLPLALSLAGSYLKENQHDPEGDPATYTEALKNTEILQHESLIADGTNQGTEHIRHVAQTFNLSYQLLDTDEPVDETARQLLTRAAVFEVGGTIPRFLLRDSVESTQEDEAESVPTTKALNRLINLGLITELEEGAIQLHRLIQSFVMNNTTDEEKVKAMDDVEATIFTHAEEINQAGLPSPLLTWQSQLQHVADQALQRESECSSALLNELGMHFRTVAEFQKAVDYLELALASNLKTYGEDHPNVAARRNNLGMAWLDLGEFQKAIDYYELALASDLKTYGEDHPNVAARHNNLGSAWEALGETQKAIDYYELALASDLKTYGEDHPSVATYRNNLGMAWLDLDEPQKAIDYLELALASDLKTYGKDHPEVAIRHNNLGGAWLGLGELQKAIDYLELALASNLKTYGEDHPEVATARNNLGLIWHEMGETRKAIDYYELALASNLKTYGEDHHKIALRRNNLGMAWLDLDEPQKAIDYYELALASDLKTYGEDHPNVAARHNNLGSAWEALGETQKAIDYFELAKRKFD